MNKPIINLFFALVAISSFISCEDDFSQKKVDNEIILEYLEDNNLTAKRHSSGLFYNITEEGTGDRPTSNSIVKVKYEGYFTDGTMFDRSDVEGTIINLNYTIEGWQIGIPLMRKGGSAIFYIPSHLGYGDQELDEIPANSVLIFEVELINIWN